MKKKKGFFLFSCGFVCLARLGTTQLFGRFFLFEIEF